MDLVHPAPLYLESYCDALRRGWSPNTEMAAALDELQEIELDADEFLESGQQ